MPKTRISAILVIGLLAGSVIGVGAQEDGSGQALAPDTGDLYCVRASAGAEPERLNEAVTAEEVTITVVPDDECASDEALDALSDAEHYGVYVGHLDDLGPSLTTMLDEWSALPSLGAEAKAIRDFDAWLAELDANPSTVALYLDTLDRSAALLEDEVAWLGSHPPRPCYAGEHEAWHDWMVQGAGVVRGLANAVRARELESIVQASADVDAFQARMPVGVGESMEACWPFLGSD